MACYTTTSKTQPFSRTVMWYPLIISNSQVLQREIKNEIKAIPFLGTGMITDKTTDIRNKSPLSTVFCYVTQFLWNSVSDLLRSLVLAGLSNTIWHAWKCVNLTVTILITSASTEILFSYKSIYIIPKLGIGFCHYQYCSLRKGFSWIWKDKSEFNEMVIFIRTKNLIYNYKSFVYILHRFSNEIIN